MRLGAPLHGRWQDPSDWIAAVRAKGYRAAYCPVGPDADDSTVRAFADEAARADVAIAEVGVWNNPMDPDGQRRERNVQACIACLDLAERIGARCCVNIAGTPSTVWDGPDPANYLPETYDAIVETTRRILDAVRPQRTFYTLEPMPWMVPDSPDGYLRLLRDVDRPGFAVHLDPVNMVNSPPKFLRNADFLRECFSKLGPWVKSIHAKDMTLGTRLTVHLDEVRPGLGGIDYRVFLTEAAKLGDVPFLLEHLPSEEDYDAAADYVRAVAAEVGIEL
ncbi:MAG: sugar phosphate isomerase/epimerase [Fimbriimonadales bacterium]|nr:sugar phosphate isomerase/epimerase [Fimbriimonadales bacterium]